MITLCTPTPDIACFGCCPPIRPAHYDPLRYVGSLRREFVENRLRFLTEGPFHRPIVGYSCWALGFLDARGRKVGCLLHPAQNAGKDLRDLIDYDKKCQRESCTAARVFAALPPDGRKFWLPLATGLNSFYFSSPRANPLFHLLGWGPKVLETLRKEAAENEWTVTELLDRARFLTSLQWTPKAHSYLFRLTLEKRTLASSKADQIESWCGQILERARTAPKIPAPASLDSHAIHTHRLPMDADFLDFLRLGLGWKQTTREAAHELRMYVTQTSEYVLTSRKTF